MLHRTLSLIVLAAAFLLAQRPPFPPHARGTQEVRTYEPRARDALLLAILIDSKPRVREHAAEGLGRMGG
jgi:hypothetical protein